MRLGCVMIWNTNAWKRINYTLWAPIYDLLASPLFNRRRRRSIHLLDLKPRERVLLVGAGTGLDLAVLPPGPTVVAIDLTPAMLSRLQRRAQRLGLNVDARVMDAHALEFPDSSFDAAILHLIVAVIPDPARCLKEVARVLRPDGRAVIFDKFAPDDARPPLALRLLNPLTSLFGTEVTRRLGPLLADAGLVVVHQESAGAAGLLTIALVRKPLEPGRALPTPARSSAGRQRDGAETLKSNFQPEVLY
jgi:ubiquinone/menaquinone biosynthesis C-methylase UbiE